MNRRIASWRTAGVASSAATIAAKSVANTPQHDSEPITVDRRSRFDQIDTLAPIAQRPQHFNALVVARLFKALGFLLKPPI